MFLNENVNPKVENFFNESEDFGGYAFGEAGIMSLNYQLSEEYHGTVEAMIAAEHSAIVNEDANLLSEAGNAFFAKVAELFKKMAEGLQKIWNQVAKFFADKVAACQKKLKEWRLGKNDLTGITVTLKTKITEFTGPAINDAAKAYAAKALSVAEDYVKEAQAGNTPNKIGAMNDGDVREALQVEKSVADDTGEFRKVLKEKFGIVESEKGEASFTIDGKMIEFVMNYEAIVKGIREAFKNAINKYKQFEKMCKVYRGQDKRAQGSDYDKETNANAVSIRTARYIASKLNVALGVAVSGVRANNSLAWAVISKAKASAKKDAKDQKKLDKLASESTILDRFAL